MLRRAATKMNIIRLATLLLVVSVFVSNPVFTTVPAVYAAQNDYGKAVFPFDLEEVRLTQGSRLYNMMNANKSYLLSLNNDSVLYSFRQTAGLSAPGTPYGGWEATSVELRGHFNGGHLLSALSKAYASTGDINCKNKADFLVSELEKCQNRMGTGYLSAYPTSVLDRLEANTSFTWAPYYTLHKIMVGLMDSYKYCGNTTALNMEKKLAGYIKGRMDKLSQSQIAAFLETRPFVWNFYHEHGGIGEAFLDLYQVTGDTNMLNLANKFDCSYLTDPLANNVDDLGYQEYHANSHIPMVIALARHYEVTNDAKYKNATVNFLNMMTNGHTFPTGGTGGTSPTHVQNMTSEYWSYPNLFYEHTLGDTGESCCSHNLNEICAKVFSWTADPKYADEYENRFVNAVLSQQNPTNGMLLYNLSVGQGKSKSFGSATNTFWCCTGSGAEAFSSLTQDAYYNDGADGLYINQFIDSTLTWSDKGLKLKQTTNYPEEEGTKLQFDLQASKEISLKLRIPSWANQGAEVKINGTVQDVNAAPGSYATINRTWNNGDTVELSLPFSLRTVRMPDRPEYVAVMYGPQLLVACTSGGAQYNGTESELLSSLSPAAGQASTFTTTLSTGKVTFKPLNKVISEVYNGYTIITKPIEAEVKDSVDVANQTSETSHGLNASNSSTGSSNGKNWRGAQNGGWFSYKMAVDSGKHMFLRCTYWGSDVTNRVFYIQVDGNNIATQRLENNSPNKFFQLIYPVPAELTNGKSEVTVKFQAKPGKQAGGLFDKVEMLTYNAIAPTPTPTPVLRQAFTQTEAEDYNNQSGIQAESCNEGGQHIGYIEDGDYVLYRNIDFDKGASGFQARVSSATSGGNIEIRLDSITGPLAGTCSVSATGDWQTWVTATCNVSGVKGIHDLYLKFTGDSGYLFNFNWWKFSPAGSSPTPTPYANAADINGDKAINMTDVMLIAAHFNTTASSGNYDKKCDLNNDGAINMNDIMIVAKVFNTVVK